MCIFGNISTFNLLQAMEGEFPELMKCPVCLYIPETAIFQCKHGHTLCEKCASGISRCPQCNVGLEDNDKVRNIALENLLDMIKFHCSFKSQGCQEQLSRKELSTHVEKCLFGGENISFCEYIGYACEYKVNSQRIKESLEHLRDKHEFIPKTGTMMDLSLTNFQSSLGATSNKSLWKPITLKAFDTNIILIVKANKTCVSFSCFEIGDGIPNSVRVEYRIMSNSEKVPTLEWTTKPIPFTRAEMLLRFPPFRFSMDLLQSNYLKDENLNVNVRIYEENCIQRSDENVIVVEAQRDEQFSPRLVTFSHNPTTFSAVPTPLIPAAASGNPATDEQTLLQFQSPASQIYPKKKRHPVNPTMLTSRRLTPLSGNPVIDDQTPINLHTAQINPSNYVPTYGAPSNQKSLLKTLPASSQSRR